MPWAFQLARATVATNYNRKRYYTSNGNDSNMRMTQELFALREEVAQLKTENETLRSQVAAAEAELRRLNGGA
jgi:hypothetical protein